MDNLISLGRASKETKGNYTSLIPNPPASKVDGLGRKAGVNVVCLFSFNPDEVESAVEDCILN